jgi:hypothetical protein
MTKPGEGFPAKTAPAGASAELERDEAAPAASHAPGTLLEEILRDPVALGEVEVPGNERSPARAAAALSGFGTRTARVLGVSGRVASIALRGSPDPVEAEIAPEVDPGVIEDAVLDGSSVLVEVGVAGEAPLVVAVLQTKRPREIRLKASVVHIEGDEELLLRSGRGAIRIRGDGDIEVVGSRISAASRGLFRLVGRILRLN